MRYLLFAIAILTVAFYALRGKFITNDKAATIQPDENTIRPLSGFAEPPGHSETIILKMNKDEGGKDHV